MGTSNEDSKRKLSSQQYYELIKYPVITICVVLGMIGLSRYAGIEFSKITKISTAGIEFANEQTANALVNVSDTINGMQAKIKELEGHAQSYLKSQKKTVLFASSADGTIPTQPDLVKPDLVKEANERLQVSETASDAIATLSYIDSAKQDTRLKGKKGYVWLGTYRKGQWETNSSLRDKDLNILTDSPDKIASKQYLLARNLKLREAVPSEAGSQKIQIGVIPEGTPVLFKSLKSGSDSQYWAEVEVLR